MLCSLIRHQPLWRGESRAPYLTVSIPPRHPLLLRCSPRVHSKDTQPFPPAASAQEPHSFLFLLPLLCFYFFRDQLKRGPLITSSERGHRSTGCRGGCHKLQTPICGGGSRLFETSSAAFPICKIRTRIPYLVEVLRRLISICRALQKTKHKAKRCSLAGRLLQGAAAALASVDGVEICKSRWRLLRLRQEIKGV